MPTGTREVVVCEKEFILLALEMEEGSYQLGKLLKTKEAFENQRREGYKFSPRASKNVALPTP